VSPTLGTRSRRCRRPGHAPGDSLWPQLEVESQFLPGKRPFTALSQGEFVGSALGRTLDSICLMREAHELPACSKELPFRPGVMIQKVGSTRKSTNLVRASRCEQAQLVSTSEAASRAACFLPFATSVVPRDYASAAAGTRARQLVAGGRAARFLLGPNGRIHGKPQSLCD
jgi:hypothetical protein